MKGMMKMKELKHDLLTDKYTKVFHERNFEHNAPSLFVVDDNTDKTHMLDLYFQEGPIQKNGVNGVQNEDLIAMVICRLEHFQQSDFSCRENALAITKLEEALLWLRKRTMGREKRGVEGTHIK